MLLKICSSQKKLSNQQRAEYFVNKLDGAPRNFFFNNEEDEMPFQDMDFMMLKNFNYDTRQQKVKGIMEMLSLGTFTYKQNLKSMTEVLTKLVRNIEDLDPQYLQNYSSEGNKIEFLGKSVLVYE